jgi:hypothetical protein
MGAGGQMHLQHGKLENENPQTLTAFFGAP